MHSSYCQKKIFQAATVVLTLIPSLFSYSKGEELSRIDSSEIVRQWNRFFIEINTFNSFSSLFACRNLAYLNIAMYESAQSSYPAYSSLADILQDLPPFPKSAATIHFDPRISTIAAAKTVASQILYRHYLADSLAERQISLLLMEGVDTITLQESLIHGERIANHILEWMNDDPGNASQYQKYVVPEYFGAWQRTPLSYSDPLTPYAGRLRRFFIDTSFVPLQPPFDFDTSKGSLLYQRAVAVYSTSADTTEEVMNMVYAWDQFYGFVCSPILLACKPRTLPHTWMLIAIDASSTRDLNLMQMLELTTFLSIGMTDAYDVVWEEKYRLNQPRPITYIQQFLEQDWFSPIYDGHFCSMTYPPYPEFPSEYSMVSATAAAILTEHFGSYHQFSIAPQAHQFFPFILSQPCTTDSTISVHYSSFEEAAKEAGWSRVYAGINYPLTVEVSFTKGWELGEHIVKGLKHMIYRPQPSLK